jgi:acyl carrier protein
MTEKRILDLLQSSFLKGEVLDAEASLFQSGLLDSMSMLTLLSLVEDLFGVSILNDGFDVREVDTVRQMACVVTRLQASRSRDGAQPVKGRLAP